MRPYRFHLVDDLELHFFGPDGAPIAQRPVEPAGVEALVAEVEAEYCPGSQGLGTLGRRLFDWLNGPEGWLVQARAAGPGVAIHLDLPGPVGRLPWEVLCQDGLFLASATQNPFTPVRRVGTQSAGAVQAQNRPLRLLFLACSPEDVFPVLRYETEEQEILDAAQKHGIDLLVEESGTLAGLAERIESFGPGHFDVLHLTGHGGTAHGQPCFWAEDDLGYGHAAAARDVIRAVGNRWPRLVFLSGCKTGESPLAGVLPSLCEALVEAGAPAVLGWGLPVDDPGATQAAAEIYRLLAAGAPIDEAVARARAELYQQEVRQAKADPQWHLLRLYANATDLGPLVTPAETPGRPKLQVRQATQEFLDAGSKSEVCPRELFVGRRRAIQRCLRVLKRQPKWDWEGVLIHGIGGLGKSSLAARLCDRLPESLRLVSVGLLDEVRLLGVLGQQLDDAPARAAVNEPELPLKNRLRKLLRDHLGRVLAAMGRKSALWVLDDFEQNVEHEPDGSIRVDPGGLAVLKPAARAVLGDLLAAIRETASETRVIVTCRYQFPAPSPPASLWEEALESFRDADLAKVLRPLAALGPEATTEEALRHRATALAAGNPRLLNRLNTVLSTAGTAATAAILDDLDKKADEFREEHLLRVLLAQQAPQCRRLLAMLAVCDLPIDRDALETIGGGVALEPHLARAAALGLVEIAPEPGRLAERYAVSGVLKPLLARDLAESEVLAACGRAARHLFRTWWEEPATINVERALEVHRLAMLARENEIAVAIADRLATRWHNRSEFRRSRALSLLTLQLGDDYRILHNLARGQQVLGETDKARRSYQQALDLCPQPLPDTPRPALRERSGIVHNLAGLEVQQGDVARAMELWNQSLVLDEQIGDVRGKAATLSNMAGVIAQQGDVARAMELWNQSLVLKEQIEDVQGKAATLANMAGVIAQQGDVARAMDLWHQSLVLKEQIGDVRGKAATLHNMAGVIAKQGHVARAMELWNQSLGLEEQIGNVQGKAATLHQMAVVIAQQGDAARAMELWNQSLGLEEQIGDVHGKAATLANMASAAGRQGDAVRQRQLNLEAARALAAVWAWPDAVIVLGNLGVSDDPDAAGFLAQALWLALRVEVPVDRAVKIAAALVEKVGAESPAAPLAAGFATWSAMVRGESHPKKEAIQTLAAGVLGACAQARGVTPEKVPEWVQAEGLDDPGRFLPALGRELEAMVGTGWLFDPAAVKT